MSSPPPPKPPLAPFKAGSAAATGRPPVPRPQPAGGSGDAAAPAPRNLELLMGLEDRLVDLPLARSRMLQAPSAGTMKVPVLADQVLVLPAPAAITEQEILERFAELADPFFLERARTPGEAVALGDAVRVSWEAVISGGGTLLTREQNVEGRVAPNPGLPGFFEGLVGKAVGARAQFSSVMPEDFRDAAARGRKVDFTVEIHQAVERTPPDAEGAQFLQALGYGSLREVMDALGQQAMADRLQVVDRQARMQVYDLLVQGLGAVIPGDWVEQELHEQWKAHRALAEGRGELVEPVADWLADPGLRAEAELRLRLDLALQATCARDMVISGPEDEKLLLEALAEVFQAEPQALKAELARDTAAEALMKKAAWFIRASEHVMGQVTLRLEEPSAPPAGA